MTPREQPERTLIDELLAEQRTLTAVDRFSRLHETNGVPLQAKFYRDLIPLTAPKLGEQYAFEVNLDQCSGCKGCVTACHSLNGLDETETWRGVGLLVNDSRTSPHASNGDDSALRILHSAFQQHVTTACHHCADPGCLNGCPVLAYDKDPLTGIVRHLDDQCIGCSYCVMKCPYEVPKYSSRRGIVRKCDMCASRLAVNEAPACVQACPHQAIKITIVSQPEIKTNYRNSASIRNPKSEIGNLFLPGSPDPRITLPTTRYISQRGLPDNLFAADHATLRLDHAHWPLVIMLTLTQAAAGMFLAAGIALFGGADVKLLMLAGFALLNLGLLASVAHLGQPFKAWRAFLGWRTSWLSREIIAFNTFAGAAAMALACLMFGIPPLGGLDQLKPELQTVLALAAALAGLAAVFTSAMVYVDTKRPLWSPRLAFGNFYGTTLLLGATFAAVVFGCLGRFEFAQPFAIAALTIRTGLFIWRRLALRTASRDSASPIHFNARVIRELLPCATHTRTWLFAASTGFGLLAITNVAGIALIWAGIAAVATFSSEIIARYVFFAAGAGKRMPGGVAA